MATQTLSASTLMLRGGVCEHCGLYQILTVTVPSADVTAPNLHHASLALTVPLWHRCCTLPRYTPAGTSVQNMAHWSQLVRGGHNPGHPQFVKFDYGTQCTPGRACVRGVRGSSVTILMRCLGHTF
jgi:hypothetical protein